MATFEKPFTFVPKTTALASQVNASVDAIYAILNDSVVHADGTNATPEASGKNVKAYYQIPDTGNTWTTTVAPTAGVQVHQFTNVHLAIGRYYRVEAVIPGLNHANGSLTGGDFYYETSESVGAGMGVGFRAVSSIAFGLCVSLSHVFQASVSTTTCSFTFRLRTNVAGVASQGTTAPPWFAIYDLGT